MLETTEEKVDKFEKKLLTAESQRRKKVSRCTEQRGRSKKYFFLIDTAGPAS